MQKILERGATKNNLIPKFFVILFINRLVMRKKQKVSQPTPPSPNLQSTCSLVHLLRELAKRRSNYKTQHMYGNTNDWKLSVEKRIERIGYDSEKRNKV